MFVLSRVSLEEQRQRQEEENKNKPESTDRKYCLNIPKYS